MHKGRHICVLHLNVLGFLLAKQVRVLVKAYSMNLPHTWRIRSNSLPEIPVMCKVDIVVQSLNGNWSIRGIACCH